MSIKRKFASSSFWVVVGTGSSNLVTFGIFVLLARLLGPKDFGLVAFATIFIELVRLLVANGFQQALVHRTEWTDQSSSSAFWLNMSFAAVAALVLAGALGPVLGWVYDSRLQPIMAALSFMLGLVVFVVSFLVMRISSRQEARS